METEGANDAEAAQENGDKSAPANESSIYWRDLAPYYILPSVTWLTISWGICRLFRPVGEAWYWVIPASLIIGLILTFIGVQIIGSGATTFMEINICSFFLLVFVLFIGFFLFPAMEKTRVLRAHEAARKQRMQQQAQQDAKPTPKPLATAPERTVKSKETPNPAKAK